VDSGSLPFRQGWLTSACSLGARLYYTDEHMGGGGMATPRSHLGEACATTYNLRYVYGIV